MLYSHLQRHNNKDAGRKTHDKDAGRKTQEWRTHEGWKTQEDFFNSIFTSLFIARFEKGCSRFACERVLETEHKLHILTSTTYDRLVVSFLFSWCSTRGLGVHCWMLAFFMHLISIFSGPQIIRASSPIGLVWLSLPHLVSNSLGVCWQLHRGFSECPLSRMWPSLPHLVSNPLGVCWQLPWDPNSTELNNNSTPTRSPTGSLNRMFNHHQAEITVMQFRGYSLPVHHCNCTMRPSPCPIS